MTAQLAADRQIPDLTLPDQNGNAVSLKSCIGKSGLVIFFYPRDNTYGCTREACAFRDHADELRQLGYQIVGISSDPVSSHSSFARKYQLPYLLLSDENGDAYRSFGLKKVLFGLIPPRTTFLVDQNGIILHKFESSFRFKKHLEEMLRFTRVNT